MLLSTPKTWSVQDEEGNTSNQQPGCCSSHSAAAMFPSAASPAQMGGPRASVQMEMRPKLRSIIVGPNGGKPRLHFPAAARPPLPPASPSRQLPPCLISGRMAIGGRRPNPSERARRRPNNGFPLSVSLCSTILDPCQQPTNPSESSSMSEPPTAVLGV